jgi:polyhydroxyalkanoate synthase subunit PhaC
MAQERFSQVVDRFMRGYEAVPSSPDLYDRWQEELDRSIGRIENFVQMLTSPVEPRTGVTPRTEVYKRNKARLYRYESARTHRVPVLFVPNLGISRPYIFDLLPGASFIEHMVQQGFDFYLLDWGVFGPEDDGLTVDDCVVKILPRVAAKVLEVSGAPELSVLGYCMGSPLAASFIAAHPEVPVRNFISMAGPIDFGQVGLFGLWLDRRFFNVDRLVDTVGAVTGDMVKAGFKLLKPTTDVTTNLNLWWNLWNNKYLEGFSALNRWANEYVSFPVEFFRQWVRDFYQDNKLYRGELRMGGRAIQLENITCPLFVVSAKEDYIAPAACVQALMDVVGSTDKEYVELPGGHISLIAGRGAAIHCWPRVSGWLAPRSAGERRTGSPRARGAGARADERGSSSRGRVRLADSSEDTRGNHPRASGHPREATERGTGAPEHALGASERRPDSPAGEQESGSAAGEGGVRRDRDSARPRTNDRATDASGDGHFTGNIAPFPQNRKPRRASGPSTRSRPGGAA